MSDPHQIQVVPEQEGEAFHHELDEGCPCGPRIEPVKCSDGSVGWIYVHHSLDGREVNE